MPYHRAQGQDAVTWQVTECLVVLGCRFADNRLTYHTTQNISSQPTDCLNAPHYGQISRHDRHFGLHWSMLPAICLPCASRSLITLVVVTYARQHVVIFLFQPQGRSDTVLAASPWQDRPPGTLFQQRHAAVILHPRSVVIWKLNCLPGRITSTLTTVSSCNSGRT